MGPLSSTTSSKKSTDLEKLGSALSNSVDKNVIDQNTSDKLYALAEAGVATPAQIKQGLDDDSFSALEPGQKGSWNKELNQDLKANHSYLVGDYLYETDNDGRVKRVSGELNLDKRDRNTYQQGKSAKIEGIKDGLSDDDGGHLIASIFDGAGEQINYAPMNSNLNRGAWKCMENEWAAALKENPPKKVKVNIRPVYGEDQKRPSKFIVDYTIDGKPYKKRFNNKSSRR
ncbi:DNA/RNA non-specific endonuclease [Vibrio metschnikovii]|uniref:DNA/RNA non-specific endonuclease n=1 Tax=Vibrio metschnikovii TaxID=28172 RepID=UPI0035581F20